MVGLLVKRRKRLELYNLGMMIELITWARSLEKIVRFKSLRKTVWEKKT